MWAEGFSDYRQWAGICGQRGLVVIGDGQAVVGRGFSDYRRWADICGQRASLIVGNGQIWMIGGNSWHINCWRRKQPCPGMGRGKGSSTLMISCISGRGWTKAVQHKGKIGSRADTVVQLCRVFLRLSGLQRSMLDQVDLARRLALERLAMMRQSLSARIPSWREPRGNLL